MADDCEACTDDDVDERGAGAADVAAAEDDAGDGVSPLVQRVSLSLHSELLRKFRHISGARKGMCFMHLRSFARSLRDHVRDVISAR
jgi:hypothetical protein